MLENLLTYIPLIAAVLVAVAYLAWRRGFVRKNRPKETPAPVYECGLCGEKDCTCHKVEEKPHE
ncbi:MAG: hypothetical protein QMD09_01215 [Desulfatibacillaceae bacterium]|nr:hypothetical protein [Desulfatibacillaceae bacterium]